jgi:hypothetical protein
MLLEIDQNVATYTNKIIDMLKGKPNSAKSDKKIFYNHKSKS